MFPRLWLVALIVWLSVSASYARDAATGALYLTTLPSGADVWVDGAYVGRSPVLIDALLIGRHTITAARTGWESRELEVAVSPAAALQFIDVQLQRAVGASRAPGRLAIHAQGKLDGLTIDGAPATLVKNAVALEPGPHELSMRTPQGMVVRHVVIYAETTTNVVLRGGAPDEDRAAVVAPAQGYLPPSAVVFEGKRLVIRYNGHAVTGMLGDATLVIDGLAMTFDSAPSLVGGKLYLPLALFVRVGAVPLRAK